MMLGTHVGCLTLDTGKNTKNCTSIISYSIPLGSAVEREAAAEALKVAASAEHCAFRLQIFVLLDNLFPGFPRCVVQSAFPFLSTAQSPPTHTHVCRLVVCAYMLFLCAAPTWLPVSALLCFLVLMLLRKKGKSTYSAAREGMCFGSSSNILRTTGGCGCSPNVAMLSAARLQNIFTLLDSL